MNVPLTDRDAVEALRLHFRLGAADARFDGRAVARAVRTRFGRLRLSVALTRALRAVGQPQSTGRAQRRRERRGAALRPMAAASPGRPASAPEEGA